MLEAVAESHRNARKCEQAGTAVAIRDWFNEADRGEIFRRQEVPSRVSFATRRSEKSVLFDTCYHGLNDAVLHQNLVVN